MLKTALKPRWIAGLLFALVVSTVFVLLSQWQFGRSTQHDGQDAPDNSLETSRPLTSVLKPGTFFPSSAADQMVTLSGHYDARKQVLVKDRLLNGTSGYWVVTAFAVDGAPKLAGTKSTEATWIPVARGWVASPADAPQAPSGEIALTGRLVPSEAPTVTHDLPEQSYANLSVAELINVWDVSSYQGFVGASQEKSAGQVIGASDSSPLKPLRLKAAPKDQSVNWLNIFYAVEWVVFAGFALFIWWRLVKDDHQRQLEEAEDAAEDARRQTAPEQTLMDHRSNK
ncbi:SURF1 family protein [Arthrobacter sp. YJM1]|uniref:SURF1-like protein n=1 Tax=Arthrobacter horti TaxID=3068273 RepID=A0ABT9IP17_9MICC|nr:SURF1 family protein [Arthrobacter sp. YJM1]MDP5227062.1 SURF1 family protein [Arthrobacter sp. YJM1]